jgi:hypothetical protein
MSNNITPPPELVQQWFEEQRGLSEASRQQIATCAAQWGADVELKACCEWLHWQNLATHQDLIPSLRAARRPKPPSLKERALKALETLQGPIKGSPNADIIRRALEQLPE